MPPCFIAIYYAPFPAGSGLNTYFFLHLRQNLLLLILFSLFKHYFYKIIT
ncbi:hypothetical protein HMPREF0693_1226 [Proteus mirabilis ATCC 29906]|nr:hypothetical protein HMPREF0693_1226 [Proteus mirabilis ATCC 29906]